MHRHRDRTALGLAAALVLASGCAFSSKARDWNGLAGLDKKPTYYMTTTKIGLNLLIFVPFLGDLGISGLTRDLTAEIKNEGGDQVRIVQGDSENYFYGWPPFTWIVTPVISTVAAEYEPRMADYAREQMEIRKDREGGSTARWFMPWTW
jgi:hypothetical protein